MDKDFKDLTYEELLERARTGHCPGCNIDVSQFTQDNFYDEIAYNKFLITKLCAACQVKILKEDSDV